MVKERNKAIITGKIISDVVYSHACRGDKFYATKIEVIRLSGTIDVINLIIPEKLTSTVKADKFVCINGEFRERMKDGHVSLFLFAKDITESYSEHFFNTVQLTGYVTSKPQLRVTPQGRKIADVIIAVNRRYGKVDYIPCLLWGKFGEQATELNIGDEITICGRMQSRDYQKPNETFTRTAYEVSAKCFVPTGNNNRKGESA